MRSKRKASILAVICAFLIFGQNIGVIADSVEITGRDFYESLNDQGETVGNLRFETKVTLDSVDSTPIKNFGTWIIPQYYLDKNQDNEINGKKSILVKNETSGRINNEITSNNNDDIQDNNNSATFDADVMGIPQKLIGKTFLPVLLLLIKTVVFFCRHLRAQLAKKEQAIIVSLLIHMGIVNPSILSLNFL